MSLLRKAWDYLKPSWEGVDGKASSKKLSLLAITVTMLSYTWHVESEVHLRVFLIHAILFAILLGIMTWSNLATLFKYVLPSQKIFSYKHRYQNHFEQDSPDGDVDEDCPD